jgi:hypothetical protein
MQSDDFLELQPNGIMAIIQHIGLFDDSDVSVKHAASFLSFEDDNLIHGASWRGTF